MLRMFALALLFASAILIYVFFLPFKMIINSIIPSNTLSQSIMMDIRSDLMEQASFRKKIELHNGPSRRYLHRTPMTVYTTFNFGMYDVYAIYINDQQEWVVRLGVFPDKNAETFFPQQIGGILGTSLGYTIALLNSMIEAGLLQPMLYHVTDKPETSFTSPTYQPVPRLI